jgi:hypothetical protein
MPEAMVAPEAVKVIPSVTITLPLDEAEIVRKYIYLAHRSMMPYQVAKSALAQRNRDILIAADVLFGNAIAEVAR